MEQIARCVNSIIDTNSDKNNKTPFLKQKIFQDFDAVTANKIIEHCEFVTVEPGILGVKVNSISLSEYEKNILRKCIYAIYGKNIDIVAVQPSKAARASGETKTTNNYYKWLEVRKALVVVHGEPMVKAWFDSMSISCHSNRILIIGKGFYIDTIKNQFATTLESIAKKKHFVIELRYDNSVYLGKDKTVDVFPFQKLASEKLSILQNERAGDENRKNHHP